MPDMLVGGDEGEFRLHRVDEPLHGLGRDAREALDQGVVVGLAAGDRHQVGDHAGRLVRDARLALEPAARRRHRAGRERGIAAGPLLLLDHRHARSGIVRGDGRREATGAGADHQDVEFVAHRSTPPVISVTQSRHGLCKSRSSSSAPRMIRSRTAAIRGYARLVSASLASIVSVSKG